MTEPAAPPAAPLSPDRPGRIAAGARLIGGVIKSYLTAPDGESYAPGRLMAFATFVICQCLVIRVSAALLPLIHAVNDWLIYFGAVAGFEAATGATCIALVMGIAPADSGGKWWGRDASPPPPPSAPGG